MKKSLIASAVGIAIFSAPSIADRPTFEANDDLLNVQNRCIVQLNTSTNPNDVTGLARAMAARGQATLKHVYKHSVKGFAVNMPCSAAQRAFGDDANVLSMEPDGIASISFKGKPGGDNGGGQEASYGTARVGGPVDGSGHKAWILDTGVDLDHPDLNVDVANSVTFITKGKATADDQNGHGTHVAGTIAAIDNGIGALGVAQGATVVSVRVLDRSGSGSYSGIIAGVDYVADNASAGDCANMSLGGGGNSTLDNAVKAAAQKGIIFAIAAGNSGDDAGNYSPGRANGNNIFTISAIDSNDNMPSWSSYGNPPVDYAAPGVGIFSLWKGGGTRSISGTSMAAPHACAVAMMKNGNPSSDGTANNDPDGNPDPIISL